MADELDGPVEAAPPAREEDEATRVGRELLAAALEGQDDRDDERPRRRPKRKPAARRARRAKAADVDEPEAARLIREAEEKHGGRRALVERFGFSEAMLSKWSTGARPCSPATLERLRQAARAEPLPPRGTPATFGTLKPGRRRLEVDAGEEPAGAADADEDAA
ncbi:MAG: hypothetical protein KIT58_04470 [Planctomycetota bacterium]|nr:hypothetical protein [Planctomycetota bacterium]